MVIPIPMRGPIFMQSSAVPTLRVIWWLWLCYRGSAMTMFRDKSPRLYCIATLWGALAAIWLRLQGPVPRNLLARTMAWIPQGIIPVTMLGLKVITFLRPGARIPLTGFDEIQWDQ